jgi:hypothetical protein
LMSFGSGWLYIARSWLTAPGVKFMAAFRARSFGLGFARVCADGAAGLDFCASCSVKLMLDFCSGGVSDPTSYCPVCFGGRVSLT